MEAIKRKVKSGKEYDHFFPKPTGRTQTVQRNANVGHTVSFIPTVVMKTLYQTEQISGYLKGRNKYETCKNIWHFVYDHITYQKDAHGLEQVRSPSRAWADRHQGIDCDCYTTLISSILTNLKIPHIYRITKYKDDNWQHIYPIVPINDNEYITIDCVVKRFNYEEPYKEKQDTPMDLQYLNGLDDELLNDIDLEGWDELGEFDELGALFKRKNKASSSSSGTKEKKGFFKKVVSTVKKGVHAVNKVNPATVLLRNGLLASMKLNLMKVAGKLKWAYLSEADAQKQGILPDKHKKLKDVMSKLEKIFHGAGGETKNLKKAILTGKGNSKNQVPMSGFEDVVYGVESFNEFTPLSTLLGHDIYHSENVEGIDGLGEPVTATAIAAASGAVASIAAIIKGIGELFPKGHKNEDGGGESGSASETVDVDTSESNLPASREASDSSSDSTSGDSNSGDAGSGDPGFWEKNKTWLKPTAIAGGGIAALYIISKAMKPKPSPPVSGVSKKPKGRKPGTVKKKPKGKKKVTPIALM